MGGKKKKEAICILKNNFNYIHKTARRSIYELIMFDLRAYTYGLCLL